MKQVTAVLVALMLISIGVAVAQDKPLVQAKVVQKIVVVQGNQEWTPTGITLAPGDKVTLQASGKVYFCGGAAQSGVGPEGWPRSSYAGTWPDDYNHCADPIDQGNHAALIADVNGQKFYVGPSHTFSGKSGLLYLGINDCSLTGPLYNSGQFSVTLKVERNAVPVAKPKP
jgi:hypothetical protein